MPPRRWLDCRLCDPACLYPEYVGEVPPETRARFADTLWRSIDDSTWWRVLAWARRRDVFPDVQEAARFAADLPESERRSPEARAQLAMLLMELGALSDVVWMLDQLRQSDLESTLCQMDPDRLVVLAELDSFQDRGEHDPDDPLFWALLWRLAHVEGERAMMVVLNAMARAPNAGGLAGSDVLNEMVKANGRAVIPVFERAIDDRHLPYEDETVSAGITMRLVLDDLAEHTARVELVGSVNTVPRTLNRVGTDKMTGRWIPVRLGGVLVGHAVTEQYPTVGANHVVFDAELDSRLVPKEWADARVRLVRVEQGHGWPGPPPLVIHVANPPPEEDP